MSLEGDGIDLIKRVEILSAAQEKASSQRWMVHRWYSTPDAW